MKNGTYYLLCEAGKRGGFGPYVGFDADNGFKLTMVANREDAKRFVDSDAAQNDLAKFAEQFGPLEIEERIGVIG